VTGLGRTNLDAEGFFAMVTGHGEVKPHLFPLNHSDPGTARVACSGMINRAHQLALTAARAFLLIDHQYLLVHSKTPLKIFKLEARNPKFETIPNDQKPKFKTVSERFRSFEHLGFEFVSDLDILISDFLLGHIGFPSTAASGSDL